MLTLIGDAVEKADHQDEKGQIVLTLQNRVSPLGEIVAIDTRGTMMGNRGGALHDAHKTLGRRRWVSRQWISCRLAFNDRHREVMVPNRYTELFFLDEVTALAAGHRPCFECRHADALRFAHLWGELKGMGRRATAAEMDVVLQAERLQPDGGKRTYCSPLNALPPGTIVRFADAIFAVVDRGIVVPWGFTGYGARASPMAATTVVDVLTPPSIVAVLGAGFIPQRHPSWPAT